MSKTTPQTQILPISRGNITIDPKDLSKYIAKAKALDEIKIVYFGTPEFSAYVLERLAQFCQVPPQQSEHPASVQETVLRFDIQAVVTSADKAVGRHQEIRISEVGKVAEKYGIPLLKPDRLNEDFIKDHLALLSADLFIVVSFGRILPQSILDIPTLGTLNIHGSILPKYRGASPIQAAILNGDQETGVSLMLIDNEMDHGPVLAVDKLPITPTDTSESLSIKMADLGAELLIKSLPALVEGKLPAIPQDHTKATYCKIINKEDGFFDISSPPSPEVLDRMVRAYYPWPNVWTKWNGKIVKFLPGRKLQMEGKNPTDLKSFLNGYPDFPIKMI